MRDQVTIAGWFGSGNVGDELLLAATIRMLNTTIPASQLMVFGANAEEIQATHNVQARALAPPGKLAKLLHLKPLYTHYRTQHTVLLGPGTIFQERSPVLAWPGTLPLFLRHAMIARLAGARLVIFGAAIREETSTVGRLALKLIALLSDSILVRDSESAKLFGPRSETVGDVVFTFLTEEASQGERRGGIGVSVRPISPLIDPQFASALNRALESSPITESMNKSFLVFADARNGANGEDDRSMLGAHYGQSFDAVELRGLGPIEPNEILKKMSQFEVVIAMRLHAVISAVMSAVPTVAVSYENKVRRTMDMLGLARYVLPPSCTAAELRNALKAAVSNPQDFEEARIRAAAMGAALSIRTQTLWTHCGAT